MLIAGEGKGEGVLGRSVTLTGADGDAKAKPCGAGSTGRSSGPRASELRQSLFGCFGECPWSAAVGETRSDPAESTASKYSSESVDERAILRAARFLPKACWC